MSKKGRSNKDDNKNKKNNKSNKGDKDLQQDNTGQDQVQDKKKVQIRPTERDRNLLELISKLESILVAFQLMLSLNWKGPFFARGRTWMQIFERFFDYIRSFLTPGLDDEIKDTTADDIAKLRPMDDVLYRRLMLTDEGQQQKFIRAVSGIEGLTLEYMETQRDYPSIGGYRSIRPDGYAEANEREKLFIVESENDATVNIEDRAIYEAQAVGYRTLYPGDDFTQIPEIYVIFIVDKDIYGDEMLIHHKQLVTKNGKGIHLIVFWCHTMDFNNLPKVEEGYDEKDWPEVCMWSNDFVQADYKQIKNEVFAELVRKTKIIESGKKVNRLSEEMYRKIDQYYEENTKQTISLTKQRLQHENAKLLLSEGVSESIISRTLGLSKPEIEMLKDELGLL